MRRANQQATASRSGVHQQQKDQAIRSNTPNNRILDELLSSSRELEVAPTNLTIIDNQNSNWTQKGNSNDEFSSQIAALLVDSLNGRSESPATSSKTITPPPSPFVRGDKFDSKSPTSNLDDSIIDHFAFAPTSQGNSAIKILDIRRSKTKPLNRAPEDSRRNNSQQHPKPIQQQSGETLSSYESDYDLLVYLGETETEDLVDTERSLDYQDQTWRQSICGGASLAPTIDESLSELLSTCGPIVGPNNLAATTSSQHHQQSNLSVTPTRLGAGLQNETLQNYGQTRASNSRLFIDSNHQNQQARKSPNNSFGEPELLWTPTSATLNSPYGKRQAIESGVSNNKSLNNWSSSLPRQEQSSLLTNAIPGPQQQQDNDNYSNEHKTSLGNKLVSLFNRKQTQPNSQVVAESKANYLQAPIEPLNQQQELANSIGNSSGQDKDHLLAGANYNSMTPTRHNSARTEANDSNSSNTSELDRLLAEMSQSLDLDSLSRYDPHKGRQFVSQQQPEVGQHQASWVQSKVGQSTRAAIQGQESELQHKANVADYRLNSRINFNSPRSTQQQTSLKSSAHSILDEYDGASKMLEQMISDQLDIGGSKTTSKPAGMSSETLPNRRFKTDVEDSRIESPRRKVSSSSAATTETSIVANKSPQMQKSLKVDRKPSDELYDNQLMIDRDQTKHIRQNTGNFFKTDRFKMHSRSFDVADETPRSLRATDSDLQTSTKSGPIQSIDLSPNLITKPKVVQSKQRRRSPSISSSSSSLSSSLEPPKPPAPDYNDHELVSVQTNKLPQNQILSLETVLSPEPESLGERVIQVQASEVPSSLSSSSSTDSDGNENELNSSKPQHKLMLNKMKRRTLTSMRSVRDKFNHLTGPRREQDLVLSSKQQRKYPQKPIHGAESKLVDDKKSPQIDGSIESNGQVIKENDIHKTSGLKNHSTSRQAESGDTDSSMRQSRDRIRRRDIVASNGVKDNGRSFGQQLRDRLSRSKSRLGHLLSPQQLFRKRAQSTPDEQRRISANMISAPIRNTRPGSKLDNELPLFQPSDVARNTPHQESAPISALSSPEQARRSDHFDSSLERHLMASLEPKCKIVAAADKSSVVTSKSSASTSDLSGLDDTIDKKKLSSRFELPQMTRAAKAAKRRRPVTPKVEDVEIERATIKNQSQVSPLSLISIKRLSGSFSPNQVTKHDKEVEDLDSMKVISQKKVPADQASKTLGQMSTVSLPSGLLRLSKRRARRRNKSDLNERKASPDSAKFSENLTPKRETTDDYFGLVAPLKYSEDRPKAGMLTRPLASVHTRVEMGPRVRPASVLRADLAETPDAKDDKSKRPLRSQSLRSVGNTPKVKSATLTTELITDVKPIQSELDILQQTNQSQLDQKAVSFQNLSLNAGNQLRQLSPVSPNSFRPTSAASANEPLNNSVTVPKEVSTQSTTNQVKPILPTQPHTVTSPARAEQELPKVESLQQADLDSSNISRPNRRSNLFGLNKEDKLERSISPPLRPPRHRKRRDPQFVEVSRRSRSLAAGQLASPDQSREQESDDEDDRWRRHLIELEASSPPESIVHLDEIKVKSRAQPSNRLAEFASQLKSSAANFFQQQAGKSSGSKSSQVSTTKQTQKSAYEAHGSARASQSSRQRPFLRNIDEPMRQEDLSHWRPIIQSNKEQTRLSKEPAGYNLHGKLQLQPSVDTDSTWESSDSGASPIIDQTDAAVVRRADLTRVESDSSDWPQQVAATLGEKAIRETMKTQASCVDHNSQTYAARFNAFDSAAYKLSDEHDAKQATKKRDDESSPRRRRRRSSVASVDENKLATTTIKTPPKGSIPTVRNLMITNDQAPNSISINLREQSKECNNKLEPFSQDEQSKIGNLIDGNNNKHNRGNKTTTFIISNNDHLREQQLEIGVKSDQIKKEEQEIDKEEKVASCAKFKSNKDELPKLVHEQAKTFEQRTISPHPQSFKRPLKEDNHQTSCNETIAVRSSSAKGANMIYNNSTDATKEAPPEAPLVGSPGKRSSGLPRPSGGSLVQRLAKNFDQTIREQSAAAVVVNKRSNQTGAVSDKPQQQAVASPTTTSDQRLGSRSGPNNQRHLSALASLELDEPKSDSTWYDAKSIEPLDEAEVAELLREFDDVAKSVPISEAADQEESMATGDRFESVADHFVDEEGRLTLSHDDTGRRDNYGNDDDDDPTLSEQQNAINEDQDQDRDQDQDQDQDQDRDEDGESVITDLNSDRSSSRADDQISLSSSSLSSETLPEMRQRQNLQKLYNIVNEICSSEEKFLATLRLLNEDFRQHVYQAIQAATQADNTNLCQLTNNKSKSPHQSALLQQAPFDCIGTILKHLPQLQTLNENLLSELKQARDQWPKTQKISHVLVKIGPFLKHYSSYIRDFELVQTQYTENLRKSSHFNQIIVDFEQKYADKCQKLSVQHHLLRPIQRIPQYRLLLHQYLHRLKPDDADYEDTVSALEVVSRVAEHANQSLNEGANFAKLLALQAKIVGRQRDLIQPGRLLIKEGELLKVCRKQIQPRWLVLLSDSLLYLKQIQSSDILYLKYELPLDDCQVSEHLDDQHEQQQQQEEEKPTSGNGNQELEFNIRTTVRSMTLVARNRSERDEWLNALRKTIGDFVDKRRSFQQAATGGFSVPASRMPELIGQKAPIWTPDSRVSTCQLCTSNFSHLFRRHHCRACGRVVCSACSSNRAPLIYLKCKAARVCDQCFEQLKANMHLYYLPSSQIDERELRRLDEHFKTLLKSQFVKHVIGWSKSNSNSSSSKTKTKTKTKKLAEKLAKIK